MRIWDDVTDELTDHFKDFVSEKHPAKDSAGEALYDTLATIHNLHFYQDLMRDIRTAIEADRFADFSREFLARYLGKRKARK